MILKVWAAGCRCKRQWVLVVWVYEACVEMEELVLMEGCAGWYEVWVSVERSPFFLTEQCDQAVPGKQNKDSNVSQ